MGQSFKSSQASDGKKIIISLDDLYDDLSQEEVCEERMMELQLTMATTSINHEYARIEFDENIDYERREELLKYMSDCRGKYLEAREEFANYNPIALETFERDLIMQKLATVTHYNA